MATPPVILIAGLGETGAELARRVSDRLPVAGVEIDAGRAEQARQAVGDGQTLQIEVGDATSALVLRRLGLQQVRAAVACTDSDEANREFLRVVAEVFGATQRVALMRQSGTQGGYEEEDIAIVPRGRACASLLERHIESGQREATDIGLGLGELVEVELMSTSPLVGKTLHELHPQRWLVGAVYRSGRLVVPHGDTRLWAEDRVLLVGEPEILPAVADLFRSSQSEFPLQYGTHVVTLCGEELPLVLEEAAWLVQRTQADKLEAIACDVAADQIDALTARCDALQVPYEFSCEAETNDESLVNEARRRDVGVLIMAPEPLPWHARIGLTRTHTAKVVDLVASPVLVARSSHPYRRVLLVLAELPFHLGAARLAIDLVRMVEAELTLAVVHQPELVVGAELRDEIQAKQQEIESLASLFHVPLTTRELSGNPVEEVLRLGEDFDLVVLSQPQQRRSFLTRPDVSQNLFHRLPCSVMTLPFVGASGTPATGQSREAAPGTGDTAVDSPAPAATSPAPSSER